MKFVIIFIGILALVSSNLEVKTDFDSNESYIGQLFEENEQRKTEIRELRGLLQNVMAAKDEVKAPEPANSNDLTHLGEKLEFLEAKMSVLAESELI